MYPVSNNSIRSIPVGNATPGVTVIVFPLSSVSKSEKESDVPIGILDGRRSALFIAPSDAVGSFVSAVLSLVITYV